MSTWTWSRGGRADGRQLTFDKVFLLGTQCNEWLFLSFSGYRFIVHGLWHLTGGPCEGSVRCLSPDPNPQQLCLPEAAMALSPTRTIFLPAKTDATYTRSEQADQRTFFLSVPSTPNPFSSPLYPMRTSCQACGCR